MRDSYYVLMVLMFINFSGFTLFCNYLLVQNFCHFNTPGVSDISLLVSKVDPKALLRLGRNIFGTKVNRFPLLSIVFNASVFAAALYQDPSLICVFTLDLISEKELDFSSIQFHFENPPNLLSFATV